MIQLDALNDNIRHCKKCSAYNCCTEPVPGIGSSTAKLMLVGGFSSSEDDLIGEPFSGREGDLIKNMLVKNNIKLEDCYFTNAIKCNTKKPKYLEYCRQWFLKELELINPKIILYMGNLAHSLILPKKYNQSTDSSELGYIRDFKSILWYHPSYILNRGDKVYKATEQILQTIKEKIYV